MQGLEEITDPGKMERLKAMGTHPKPNSYQRKEHGKGKGQAPGHGDHEHREGKKTCQAKHRRPHACFVHLKLLPSFLPHGTRETHLRQKPKRKAPQGLIMPPGKVVRGRR